MFLSICATFVGWFPDLFAVDRRDAGGRRAGGTADRQCARNRLVGRSEFLILDQGIDESHGPFRHLCDWLTIGRQTKFR